MVMMNKRDEPTYYNIKHNGILIAYRLPKTKVQKAMKQLALTYRGKMEVVLLDNDAEFDALIKK